ncbi:hypothetical protein chiPu_0017438 [Chiloscyllium punctatum]|uniref:Uncharacterized protein n=1 Tax=Chiloscyllium punctatum TaxID=137246 RepID=A0A401RG45_CHIPU|nr:hypothetical protein [Chiloscyllium punctatum]
MRKKTRDEFRDGDQQRKTEGEKLPIQVTEGEKLPIQVTEEVFAAAAANLANHKTALRTTYSKANGRSTLKGPHRFWKYRALKCWFTVYDLRLKGF